MAVPVNVILVAAGISGVIVMQEQKQSLKSKVKKNDLKRHCMRQH